MASIEYVASSSYRVPPAIRGMIAKSVIGALYAVTDGPCPTFEARVRVMLAQGLAGPTVKTKFCTTESQ